MPELYSQVLDLKEKDVFLETEVNDTRYFSITGVPSIISYGKHPFSITFNDPIEGPLLRNLSNIVFEFVDSRGTVIFSDLLDVSELSGAGNGVLWIKKDPLRTAAEISDGPVFLYVMGELDGDEIPEEWRGIYNLRSTFIFNARKDYPNTSNLVLKNPSSIQTNLNISESIEFDTTDSVFKRSFINVSLTNLDTDGGKIDSIELAYNEQSASNDEYEIITRYPLTSGSYETKDQEKTSGLNPITNLTKIITPKQFRRNTSVRFRLRFVNPAGQVAQYLDEDRQGEVVEVTSSFIIFEGSPFFIEQEDNLLRGSMFTGNAVGKGFEQSGKNSAFLKTVDYEGFISASIGSGSAGILFYSGSVLTSSGDNYNGVGLELHGGKGSGSFRFSTSPNLLEITADTFFVGSENSQFISGSGGNIEISSSDFHLTSQGQVTASAILIGDKGAGQFLQFIDDTLTVQGSITADSIRTPSSIAGAPSTDQNASSSISAGGFATFKSASIGGFVISPTDISSSGLILKSSGQMTGSSTLIGDKGAGQFLQFAGSSLTVQGDITANSIRTPSSIAGSPSTAQNASSSIDSQGFALFKSASIGGFVVNETQISSSGLVFKSGGEMTGSATLIGNKSGGNFLQFTGSTLTVQGDITANSIKTPATIGGVASTVANASASITSDGLATFKSGSIAGWQIFGNILSGSNVSLDSQGAALFKSDQGPGSDTSAALDQLRDEYYIDFTPADQGNSTDYYVKFGPNFMVDSDGILIASGAKFEGTITASAGLIGGFTADDDSLSSTNLFLSGSPLVGGIDDDKYMFISTSNFNVKQNGDITASAANITGDITANTITANTAGTIANFTINSSEIKSSNNNLRMKSSGQITGSNVLFDGGKIGGFSVDAHSLTTTGAEINDSSQTLFISSSAFKVKHSGVISGSQVDFTGGTIGGFTLTENAISSSNNNLRLKNDGQITGSNVLFSGGKIAGFDISGTKLQQDGSFHLDGNASADYFISSSRFQVTPSGDVSGSQVLFTGGKIGGFTLSDTEISSSGLLLQSSGKISGSQVFFTGGTVGGFTITDSVIKNNNNTVSLSSTLPGLLIKDGGGTDRVLVKSGSLSTVGGGTQYIGNKSFEVDSISGGRNFVSSITSWSFAEGGGVNISLTDRSGYPDDDKAVSGNVTLDVVVPAGSGNYSSNNTYELVQVITSSISQGDTLSFSSVARFSSSFGGRGKDRALGPQYFRLEYSGSDTDGFVPFLPQADFTASNGYGEYFLGSGQYSSFGASADLPGSAEFIKVILTGSINDDTGFSIEKPLFAGDKGTVNSELKGKKFTKQVVGSATAEFPETEITFDNFSVRSNTRRVEVTQEGILIYNSEDSFFKMTGAGIELRGGSGVASFGQAINRESFTNDSQVAGTLGAPSLQAYVADPEDIGTTASDGNVADYAKGNHVHRITFSTINSVLAGQTLTNVFNGTFGSDAGTLISGSFTLVSSSISTRLTDITSSINRLTTASSSFSSRVTTLEQQDVDDDLTIAGDSGGNLTIDMDSETLTLAGGAGLSSTGVGNTITFNLDSNMLSSSAQIASDISGSITSFSSSIAGRVSTEESNVDTLQARNLIAGTGLTGGGDLTSNRTFNVGGGTGITANADDIEIDFTDSAFKSAVSGSYRGEGVLSGSAQIASDISGSLGSNADLIRSLTAAGISGSYRGEGVLSGSAQIATDISGSFTSVSSSFSSRVSDLEATDTDDDLTVAGDSGGNLSIDFDSETLTIAGGTNINTSGGTNTITVNLDDNISGSAASTASFGDGRIAGKLGIQTTTPRGNIDVLGSNGSQGFYVSTTGLKVYLPTDVAHSSGAGTFDFQVENLRLGRSGYGAVTVYPRFNSMLQLGTQDDTNLLTLSGSTKISGSSTSTGSFGHVFTSGTSHFSGHVGIQTAPGSSNELTVGGGGFVKAEYFRGQKFYFHSNNAGMAVASNHIYFDDNDLTRIFHIKRDGGVQISGSHDSTGSFGHGYIDSKLGIGTTSPVRMLDIVGSTAAMNIDSSGNAFITIDRGATNDVGQIEFKTAGSAKWYVGMTDSGNFSDGTEFYIGEGSGAASDRHLIIDASGNIEFQAANAKISGSSTSTGSFGLLQTTDRIQTPSDSLKVKGNLTLDGTNIPTLHLDGLVDAIVRIDKAASYRAAQLRFDTGGSADWFIGTPDSDNYGDGDELYFGTSADTPIVAIDPNASTGLLNLTSNKISGSSTSTGSFGEVHTEGVKGLGGDYGSVLLVPDTLQFGNDTDSMLRRRTSNDVEFRMAGTDIVRINTSGLQVENGSLEVESGNVIASGNISGSATSTGSFGHVVITSPGDALELRSSGAVNTAGNTVSIDFTTNVYPTAGRNAYIDASQDSSNRGKLTIGAYGTVGGSTTFYDILQIHAQDGNAVISGSSISTGSFGRLNVDSGILIRNQLGAATHKLQFTDDNVGLQRAGGSDRTANGNSLYISAYEEIVLTTGNGVMGTQYERIRTVSDGADASITFPSVSKISGSSTSTGSFGAGFFGGNVGVGIDPVVTGFDRVLHIAGTNTAITRFTATNYGNTSSDGGYIGLNFGGIDIWQKENNYMRFATNNTERIRITNDGKVGIGTTSPGQKLTLQGGNMEITGSGGQGIFFTGTADGSNKNALYFRTQGGTEKFRFIHDASADNTNDFQIKSNASSNMVVRMLQNGDFMLGNTVINPASGYSNQKGFGYDFSTGEVQIATTANAQALTIGKNQGTAGALVVFRHESTVVGQIDTAGGISGSSSSTGSFGAGYINNKLGIGDTSPDAPLDIEGSANPLMILNVTSGNSALHFQNAGTTTGHIYVDGSKNMYLSTVTTNPAIFLKANGNIGIGNTNPPEKLTVEGDISASGDFIIAGNISGSSSSTGSFGSLHLGASGRIAVGHTVPQSPLHIKEANDGGSTEIIIDNTAAGDSTDEKSSIRFRHNGGTAAMIIVDRVENFSDSANRTGKMTLRTFNDDSGVDALELSNTGKATFAGEVEINSNDGLDVNAGAATALVSHSGGAQLLYSSVGFTTATAQTVVSHGTNIKYQLAGANKFIMSSSGDFGIGTTSPHEMLHLKSSTDAKPVIKLENSGNNSNSPQLVFLNSGTADDNDITGTIRFKLMNDAGSPEEIEYGTIYGRAIDVSDGTEDGELHFRTRANGVLDSTLTLISTEATFRGNVNLGDNKALTLGADSDAQLWNDGSNTYLRNNTSNQDIIFQGNDDGSTQTEMLRIDTSLSSIKIPNGNLYFSNASHQYILKNTGSSLRLKHEGTSAGDDIIFELSDGGTQHKFDHDGTIDFGGDVYPDADNSNNLGSASARWKDVFAVQTTTGGVFETGLKTENIGDNPTGTIVSWREDGLVPCDSNEDELVMGVIKEGKDEPIVMGAEPVLVTGKVNVGDYIVTSDKIGHGKSVKRGYLLKKDLFGKVIAQALESSDDSDSCLIKCMIRKM